MKKNKGRKLISSLLLLSFVVQQSSMLPAIAEMSNITGVTPIGGANGEFNIHPEINHGDMGFRHYKDFNLAKDDIANLIFAIQNGGDVSKFVNLVDNRININGIVNSLGKDFNFYNGHAIFVSPNGMVVGASGVLNVGSLTVIAPNATDYLKYTGYYMGQGVLDKAGEALGVDTSVINIPIDDSVNLKLLKESDSNADIIIQGKIFARDSVELLAKNINIGNTSNSKAGIFAGLPAEHDLKIATVEQAERLFNALVTNNIQQGTGFDRDSAGNIIIKAQSVKTAELSAPSTLLIKGVSYALEQLFEIVDNKPQIKENLPFGITSDDVRDAYKLAIDTMVPPDASDPSVIDSKTAAKVNINNAVLAGKNVDINAASKVTYTAQKGSSIFERTMNSIAGDSDNIFAEVFLDKITSSSATFSDFEGSRAKAQIEIGEGSTLFAKQNIDVKSLAVAETSIKIKSMLNPALDTSSEGFYYLGSKTDSSAVIKSKAELIAGNDINVLAASKNSLNLKIKNPTSMLDSAAGTALNAPSIQVSVLQSVIDADTKAEVQSGAKLKAGNNVNVTASNYTSAQTMLNSVANIAPSSGSASNSGIAVAINLQDSNITTSAIIDGEVTAGKDVNVDAQNMHVSINQSKTSVEKAGIVGKGVGKLTEKAMGLLKKKVSGIDSALDSIADAASLIPDVSASVVVNTSEINTNAKIGKNAVVNAGNDVNLNANTIDMSVNNATSSVKASKDSDYIPSPGVSVIVNDQKNNTVAVIEDGNINQKAQVNAGHTVRVNATAEQPMNQTTFEFALNLLQTGEDVGDMFSETPDNLSQIFSFNDDSTWDFRVLMESLRSPADEVMYDIKNLMFDVKNSGLTSTLGLQGFFNNWAQSTSNNPDGIGLAASVVVSDVINNTQARVGDYAVLNSDNVIVNAANAVTQFNAAGDVSKLWKLKDGASGGSGIGGTVLIENVTGNALAQIGNNADVTAKNNVNVLSANDQDFLTVVMTGSKAQDNKGVALSGSTIIQNINGKTESSIGSSKVKTKNLKVKAGEAQISKVPTALEQLQKDPFADLDSDRFEVGLEDGMQIGEIRKFTETDVSLGVDTELGFAEDEITATSVITGTGLANLNSPVTIKDGISNMMITGALATQKETDAAQGSSGSSGVAAGASVNVSEFSREVDAFISDGAIIELEESLDVIADTKTQSLNIALAGAFAGGVDMKKEPGFIDNMKDKLKHKAEGYLVKVQGMLSNVTGLLGSADDSPKQTGKLDDKGNPILSYNGTEYKTDLNGQYYDPKTGTVLKDASGNPVKAQSSGLGGSGTTELTNKTDAAQNMSAALAGSVNAQINNSTVKAEVGNAKIIVGKNVNVEANQTTNSLNIGGGVAKASTVGAGAAVNFIQNSNKTEARLNGTQINFKNSANQLSVKALESNDNIQVAIGVGAATGDKNNPTNSAALGGSFNTDILTNSVIAEINDAVIKNIDGNSSIAVDVNAENHSTSYKGAGGMSINTKGSTSVGAGMAGNLNLINKTTKASIDNSDITNANRVSVSANKDKSIPTENIIDVGVGGSVITGAKNAYSFYGAMATDVVRNTVIAQITNGSTISTTGDVDVLAYNNLKNWNAAGALGFSSSQSGAGVGAGAIVNIVNNTVNASISGSEITDAANINVNSYNKDDLNFVAFNMGIQKNGTSVNASGIVNVIKSNISASVVNSIIAQSSALNVISDYDADIFGVTGTISASLGKGLAFGANILSNTLLSNNIAKIENSTVNSSGKVSVNANSTEKVDVIPVAAAVSVSGTAAAAANVGVNVVSNTTKAYIDNNSKKITSNGLDVTASDSTTSRSRGGTLSVSGGTAAVGGSIISDVYIKDVSAYIDNAVIANSGDIKVKASAKNIFGMEDPGSITASDLSSSISDGSYDVSKDTRFDKWDMTFDVSGASSAGISGSMISKTVVNDVNAYIGSNTVVESASAIEVSASNKTNSAAIIGNVSAGGSAAVGGSLFVNVNAADVNAYIANGAKIGTVSNVGDITVDAKSIQDYHAINFAVGGSGAVAVTGSLISNVVVNETNSYIGKNVIINSDGSLTVTADDSLDIQSIQLAVAGSGAAAVGGIANVNVLNNKVNAIIGQNDDAPKNKQGNIFVNNDVNVGASSSQDYQANVLMVAGSGAAAVSGVAISNTMATNINAGIEEITLTSNGTINVSAENSYNKKHQNRTSGIRELLGNDNFDADMLTSSDYVPLVMVLNVSGAGAAAINGSVVNNNVITAVNSYVKNADVTSSNGLNVSANSNMTTYDATMGVAGSAAASIASTGVVNVYSGSTKAEISDSIISGSVNTNASDTFNLNAISFAVAGAGVGAAITPVVNVNTISNSVVSNIINTEITNAQSVQVSANNTIYTTNASVSGSGVGVGASIGLVPVTNVFTGTTKAAVENSELSASSVSMNANNTINTSSIITGVAFSGAGANVSGYALTNVFDNDLEAYIKNSTLSVSSQTSVNANSDLDMGAIIAGGGVNGAGASVIVNSLTNVIKNNVNSYIEGSDIKGGNISVTSAQNSNISNNTASAGANGIGNSTIANSIVNVFTNNLTSYIKNSSTNNTSSITVSTDSDEILTNLNMGASVSGTSATPVNSIVNVLENTSHAYIDAQNKTMNSTGKISVKSDDNLTMKNEMGLFAASGFGAAGANINVNVINNTVKSEVLSAAGGGINAGSMDVNSNSLIALNETFASAAAGIAGVAGNVIINSIGSKVNTQNSELSGANIAGTLDKANENYKKNTSSITYQKDGSEQTLENAYSLTGSTNNEGTISNISANVTTTGGIKVTAKNQVKGTNSDTLTLTNVVTSGGAVAAGASVLVNDMNYNTASTISGGHINAQNGNITLDASSKIKSNIQTKQATIGLYGIGGNVGYFKNNSLTQAIISNASIDAKNISINALSEDSSSINVQAISAKGVGANLSIAISETTNKVYSKISGNNVEINADKIDITSSNTSSLKSELETAAVSGIGLNTIVNRAKSNAVTQALIDASGTINLTNALNIIASSNGINAETTMALGSIAAISGSANVQGAYVNSGFKSGINNSNLTINNSGNTVIKSGVKTSNNNEAAEMKAEVISKKASVSLAETTVTDLTAEVTASTEAISNAKQHKANNLTIESRLKRTANVGSSSGSLGAITLGVLNMTSNAKGSNTITLNGSHEITDNINIALNDNANVSTSMLDARLSLIGGSVNNAKAVIDSDTTVNFGGNVASENININHDVTRNSINTADSKSAGLVQVNKYKILTETSGDSNINISATIDNDNYKNNLTVNSSAKNNAESILSANMVALAAIARDTSKNKLSAVNNINIQNANIKSNGNIKFSTKTDNRATMKRNAEGSGFVIISGGELNNDITAASNIKAVNSNIIAKNIELATNSNLGTKDNKEVHYTVSYSGAGIAFDSQTVSNTINQTSRVDILNSDLHASDKMNVKIDTTSNFTQGIESDGQGFVAKNTAYSYLTVTNNNEMNIDANSKLFGHDMDIAFDSSNTLKSYVDIDVSHFGGRNPGGESQLTLNVNNTLNNKGSIQGGNSAQIDFMKNSRNNLTQDTSVIVEAAVATANADGKLAYNVNNKLNVEKGSDITAAKDVIVNYTAGTNKLNARTYSKKTSRLLFGIPITKTSEKHNITQNITNSLKLDGEIVAGSNARRYMLIDKDGNINMSELKGFLENEYKVVDAVSIDSETLTKDAIKTLENQINELKAQLEELGHDRDAYSAELQQYTNQLAELQSIYNSIENLGFVLEGDLANTMKDNIQNNIVGDSADKVSQDVFDRIYSGYSDYISQQYSNSGSLEIKTDIATYLKDFVITPESTDKDGNVIPAVKLTENQIQAFTNAFNNENNKVTTVEGTNFLTYNGQVIVSSADEFGTAKSELQNSINSLTEYKEQVDILFNGVDSRFNSLNSEVASAENQITYLQNNPLDTVNVEKAAIEFDNIRIIPSKIELNGLVNTNITGNGDFKTFSPNLVIDNYSNRDLIFKNVDLGNSSQTGLIIGGTNYSQFANTLKPVNKSGSFDQIQNSPIGVNVHYIMDADIASNDKSNLSINNYYDHSNPALSSDKAVASDITFSGYVISPGKLSIFNDSGDISFGNYISAVAKDVTATQGDVIYKAANTTLELKSGDRIFAGKNIDITAHKIINNGLIRAGYGDRNVTITDEMLSNLIVDPTTGEKNMINFGGSEKSAYLENSNNIKALYKDGKIVLFNTKTGGGDVKLTGTVSGNGAIAYTNGYADVVIENNTNKELVVNTLENNRMNGTASNTGSLTNVTNPGKDHASTTITSAGKVSVIGAIINGKDKISSDTTSVLNIISSNGVEVTKKLDEFGNNIPTIDAVGDINFENTNSSIITNGIIQTVGGNINIQNAGNTTTINNLLSAERGNISLSNTSGKLTVTKNASISAKKGSVEINNNGINTELSGTIKSENGDISVNNAGGELLVNTTISANGKIKLENSGDKGINFTDNSKVTNKGNNSSIEITNTNGGITLSKNASISNDSNIANTNLKISNTGNGLIAILGSIFNKKGNVEISSDSTENGVKVAQSGTITAENGDLTISNTGAQGVEVSGKVLANNGNTTLKNSGAAGVNITQTGKIKNDNGNTEISNTGDGGIEIAGTVENSNGNISTSNTGKGLIAILGSIFNKKGNIEISSDSTENGVKVAQSGTVTAESGDLAISNTGAQGVEVSGKVLANNGNTTVKNSGAKGINITQTGKIKNDNGNTEISNTGDGGIEIAGTVENSNGNISTSNTGKGLIAILGSIFNKKGNIEISSDSTENGVKVAQSGTVTAESGDLAISNTGAQGVEVSGKVLANNGNTIVKNSGAAGINVTQTGKIQNDNGNTEISNTGDGGIEIAGTVLTQKGNSTITNSGAKGIKLSTTGTVTNGNGNISIENKGKKGIDIEGIVSIENVGDISITNRDSNIEIGELDSLNDSYIRTANGNIVISQINGNILNGITTDGRNKQNHNLGNPDKAYKTLINSSKNLTISVQGGNIGDDTHALEGKDSGFGTNASTRDYTESVNINIGGKINITAKNNNNALVNLRAKESDLRIDKITSDGNIMLTAADWKQADKNPTPSDEAYYQGYSIINAISDNTNANITGRNISLISSNNIGERSNTVSYNQLEGGSISALAENNLYTSSKSQKDNIWQMVAKRGDMKINLNGESVIREISSGGKLEVTSAGNSLTIYDLGKVSNINSGDDILFPHDRLSFENNDVTPQEIILKVLGTDGNSTLNIYNAYVRGKNDGTADVTLRADNIIAHAYDAASSVVSTKQNPNGFDAKDGRTYSNDFTDPSSPKDLKATGFNTAGKGNSLVFDIQGVSPDDIAQAGGNISSRNYNAQNPIDTIYEFKNPNTFTDTVYKANNVLISLNSSSTAPSDNRGMQITNLYADNAYIDTKDLTLNVIDGFITNYAEFRNGNRGGTGGGHTISEDYRWLNIVDNDFKRNIGQDFNIPVTSQLYTALTGSFELSMGDKISQNTKAPVVVYDPYETVVKASTENSFYRLAYKDDKVQNKTILTFMGRIDPSTYLPNKRQSLRFKTTEGIVETANKFIKDGEHNIISVVDISRGGLLVTHNGKLKEHDKFNMELTYNDITANVEVEVVRLDGDRAGLEFINLDPAAANKILFMNLSIETTNDVEVTIKKSQK